MGTFERTLKLLLVAVVAGCSTSVPGSRPPPVAAASAAPPSERQVVSGPLPAPVAPRVVEVEGHRVDLTPLCATGVAAQGRAAFEAERWEEALDAFDAAVAAGIDVPQCGYLAAVSAMYAGHHDDAARRFAVLVHAYPLLVDYHRFFAARASLLAGHPRQADTWLAQVDPKGANARRASRLRVDVRRALGDVPGEMRALRTHLDRYGSDANLWLALADAARRAGDRKEAAEALRAVLVHHPASAQEREAREALRALLGPRAALLSAEDELARARTLFEAHRNRRAVEALEALLPRLRGNRRMRCEALWMLARSWDKRRVRKRALPVWRKARKACSRDRRHAAILYYGGLSHYRAGKPREAIRWFRELHRVAPHATTNDDAYLWEAHAWRDLGKLRAARRALERAWKAPDGDMRAEVAWWRVWLAYRARAWKAAARLAADALRAGVEESAPWNRGRLGYWRGRALQRMGRRTPARRAFEEVLRRHPLSYYAVLAQGRLEEVAGAKAARRAVERAAHEAPPVPNAPASLWSAPPLRRGVELLRLGLERPAAREFALLLEGRGAAAVRWAVAALLARAGRPGEAHRLVRRDAAGLYRAWPTGAWRGRWQVAYPRPWREAVEEAARRAGIDADFVWAIMREESAFNASVRSWAGAVGLMQLMPATAARMASSLGLDRPDERALADPLQNIRLGATLLGRLGARLSHPALVAAAYNAGEASVRSWLRKRGDWFADSFVEAIPYRQTRRYVVGVLSSYAAYRFLRTGTLPRWPLAPVRRR